MMRYVQIICEQVIQFLQNLFLNYFDHGAFLFGPAPVGNSRNAFNSS